MPAPRKTAQTEDSDKTLSTRILVTVRRDITATIARAIWQHEYPLLEAIHGEGNVVLVDPKTLDEGYSPRVRPDLLPHNKKQDKVFPPSVTNGLDFVFSGDAESEYERMAQVYGRAVDRDILVVELIYGRFQEGKFKAMLGSPTFDDMPAAQLRGIIQEYGYIPQTDKDSTPEERKAASAKQTELLNMGESELRKLAEEVTAEYA